MLLAARMQAGAWRMSSILLRGAKISFVAGAGSGLLALVGNTIVASGSNAIAWVAALATGSLLVSSLLVVAMLCSMLVEMLVPTLLGPPSRGAHLMSRRDLEALRPLLTGGPARFLQDAWDVLRMLRP